MDWGCDSNPVDAWKPVKIRNHTPLQRIEDDELIGVHVRNV
jgi:hypothetical protein